MVAVAGVAGVAAAFVTTARDYLLSGWLQFPLSVHAFNVDWLAPDPVGPRTATLGAARDPADLWNAAAGWGWIGAWLRRLPTQWETFEFLALAGAAVVLLVVAHRRAVHGLRWKAMCLVLVPSVAAVVFWWAFTPPSFRFIWGPLFTMAAVPIGWSLWRLRLGRPEADRRDVWLWLTVVAVTALSVVFRFQSEAIQEQREWTLGVSIPYAIAPITKAPVVTKDLGSGLVITQPTQSDQCWDVYPLCSPQLLSDIKLRGAKLQDGFAQRSAG
jgi:hypothetical protein